MIKPIPDHYHEMEKNTTGILRRYTLCIGCNTSVCSITFKCHRTMLPTERPQLHGYRSYSVVHGPSNRYAVRAVNFHKTFSQYFIFIPGTLLVAFPGSMHRACSSRRATRHGKNIRCIQRRTSRNTIPRVQKKRRNTGCIASKLSILCCAAEKKKNTPRAICTCIWWEVLRTIQTKTPQLHKQQRLRNTSTSEEETSKSSH